MANATNNGYTNVRDSAHDYETSGETIDWSYYATRGFAVTPETVGGSSTCNRASATNKAGKAPNYVNCTTRRLHRLRAGDGGRGHQGGLRRPPDA